MKLSIGNIFKRPKTIREPEDLSDQVYFKWVAIRNPNEGWPAEAERIRQNEEFEKFGQPGTGPCPDCVDRQDRVEPLEVWQAIGEPGSGWSVCRGRCRCKLVEVSG